MCTLVAEVHKRWPDLDRHIAALDAEFPEQARSDEHTRRLATIPGIGALKMTALVAVIGDVNTFARARSYRMARPSAPAGHYRQEAQARRHHKVR